MKKSISILSVFVVSVVFLLSSCGSPTSDSTKSNSITISGKVVNAQDNPIQDAIVRIISPPPEKIKTTDSTGTYSFEITVDSAQTYTIEARKEGYPTKTDQILAIPDRNVKMPNFKLASSDTTNGGGNNGNSNSEGSAFISLDNVSSNEIQVNGTGGTETSKLTFLVTDSAGTPISNDKAVYLHFNILEGPDGGESIYPDSVLTQNGQATATLKSGTVSGVVQIQASFSRKVSAQKSNPNQTAPLNHPGQQYSASSPSSPVSSATQTVSYKSKPVSVTISGGLPSENHFSIKAEKKNQVASEANQENTINVLLGDKYGNDVPEGTSVYFKTDLGTITRSDVTDQNGHATATLQSNNTSPGIATVTVETINDNSQTISKQLQVVFSGTPELTVTPQNVSLNNFTEQKFDYTLQDKNGNPLASGTSISVSVDNSDLTLSGDTDVTIPDAVNSGSDTTDFSFTLSNPNQKVITDNISLKISSDGPNGSATKSLTLTAADAPAQHLGNITLSSVSNNEIGVIGTGQTEQSQLTFQVTDSTGQLLTSDNATTVNFKLGASPGGNENLDPKKVTTDASGQATTTLTSGTKAGVVQVVATVTKPDGTTITSQPVAVTIHAGLPAEDHFTLTRAQKNVAYDEDAQPAGKVGFTVYAGDKYNNTVPEGTSIYFKTTGGYIDGSAQTNAQGEATVTLTAKKKFPTGGVATITAETANDNQQTISDDTKLIFSKSPQISVTPTTLNLKDFRSKTFSYTVEDTNENPLEGGTSVFVTVDNSNLQLSGDTDVAIPDAINSGPDTTDFGFTLSNPDNITFTKDATITIATSGPNGSATKEVALTAPDAPTLNPGEITLSNVTYNKIGVVSTGQTEQTQLTFQVTDSSGRSLNLDNQAEVRFSLGASPGGGENVSPSSVMTDADGQATTTLTSGTKAGVAQVVAEVTASDGSILKSQPVAVAIHAGLPDQDHFTLQSETNNIPAESGSEVKMTAYVGDKYGNTVAEGTTIYFTTDGGYISGSAQTDQDGIASAILRAVKPTPADGTATVTASTANDLQNQISVSKDIIFSGGPTITVSPSTINMPNDSNTTFNYTVEDSNGYPMAPGTKISVNVEGNKIETIGDTDITVGEPNNSFTNTSQLTDFQFNIRDAAGDTVVTDPVQITITSDGPNGTAKKTISGTKNKSIN